MSQIRFYRALLLLPALVPVLLVPVWFIPGAAESTLIGPLLYGLTFGPVLVAVPYVALALWTDRWLRRTPHPEPAAVWRRALRLPLQLAPLYVVWQALPIALAVAFGGQMGPGIIRLSLIAAVWVVAIGYVYVGLAYGLTRVAARVGCVRAPTHASAN